MNNKLVLSSIGLVLLILNACYGPEVIRLESEVTLLKESQRKQYAVIVTLEKQLAEVSELRNFSKEHVLTFKANTMATLESFQVKLSQLEGLLEENQHMIEGFQRASEETSVSYRTELSQQIGMLKRELDQLQATYRAKKNERNDSNMKQVEKLVKNDTTFSNGNTLTPILTEPAIDSVVNDVLSPGRKLFDAGKFNKAVDAFEAVIKSKNSDSKIRAEAQYWLALSYYNQQDFIRSISEFQKVVDQFASSRKVCFSILKQGEAFLALKKTAEAKIFLDEVVADCKEEPKLITIAQEKIKLLPTSTRD